MLTSVKLVLVGVLMSFAAPTLACDNYPDLPPLPGEKVEETKARNDRLYESLKAVRNYEAQKGYFGSAKRIYLARVLKRKELSGVMPLFSVEVEPVRKIKGVLPTKPRTLSDLAYNSCGSWGGGDATKGQPGDWVIVFEGFRNAKDNAEGIFARDALVWDLVEAVEKFSLDLGYSRRSQ